MQQPYQFTFKPTILHKQQQLIIDSEFLLLNDLKIPKAEIAAIRYGVKGIKGYRFYIGRIYCIDIKTLNGKILKLRLKSIYRVRKQLLYEKYAGIVNALFRTYFDDITRDYLTQHENKTQFSVLGIVITPEGVQFDKSTEIISWFYLDIRTYWQYFTIFPVSNPANYKAFYYLQDWNAGVLLSVLRTISKERKHL